MKTHLSFSVRFLIIAMFLCASFAVGQELQPIILPAPQTDGGKPLMQVLRDRHSTREFSSVKLPRRCSRTCFGRLSASIGRKRKDRDWAGPRPPP